MCPLNKMINFFDFFNNNNNKKKLNDPKLLNGSIFKFLANGFKQPKWCQYIWPTTKFALVEKHRTGPGTGTATAIYNYNTHIHTNCVCPDSEIPQHPVISLSLSLGNHVAQCDQQTVQRLVNGSGLPLISKLIITHSLCPFLSLDTQYTAIWVRCHSNYLFTQPYVRADLPSLWSQK